MDQDRIQFLGSGDAFGSGGRFQTCLHLSGPSEPVLMDCGASSLIALRRAGLDPSEIGCVLLTHLHGDHFGGLPFLILDGQFMKGGEFFCPRALDVGHCIRYQPQNFSS